MLVPGGRQGMWVGGREAGAMNVVFHRSSGQGHTTDYGSQCLMAWLLPTALVLPPSLLISVHQRCCMRSQLRTLNVLFLLLGMPFLKNKQTTVLTNAYSFFGDFPDSCLPGGGVDSPEPHGPTFKSCEHLNVCYVHGA